MRRCLTIAVVGCAVGLTAFCEDAKKAAQTTADKSNSELTRAKAKFDAEVKEKLAEIRKARTAEEADDLQKELREFKAIEMDGLLDVAVSEPETEIAFDIFAELIFGGFDEKKSKLARTMIEKHHLEQAHVKKVILQLVTKGDTRADILLKVIADKNPDKDCQGMATYALGLFAKNKIKQAGGEAKTDETKRAKAYFAKAKEKYADVKVGEATIAKLATNEIEAVNLIGQLEIGKPVPNIVGEDLDGKVMKLSDLKGKVVMLSFWATWCPPCMALVPHEKSLTEKYKDQPFALIGINGDAELSDEVRGIIKDRKITWPSFKDEQKDKASLSQLWEIEGWPTIYLIDHKGIIQQKWAGSPGERILDEALEKLVLTAEKELKK